MEIKNLTENEVFLIAKLLEKTIAKGGYSVNIEELETILSKIKKSVII